MEGRARGLAWATGGILMVTPDSVLVRWMRSEGATVLQVFIYKYLSVAIILSIFIVVHVGGCSNIIKSIRAGPKHILVAALCQVGVSYGLNLAFAYTVVARALFGLALSVVWSALLSRAILKETLPIRTVLTVVCAIACAFVVYLPGFVPSLGNSSLVDSQATVHGDLFGVFSGASLGVAIATARSAGLRAPGCETILGLLFGTPLVVMIAIIWSAALGSPIIASTKIALIGLLNGVCVGCCYFGTLLAPRYILSAEVGLIGLLELVLGPIWVFAGFGEVPSVFTFVGGGMLIVVLALHEISGCMAAKRSAKHSSSGGSQSSSAGDDAIAKPVELEVI